MYLVVRSKLDGSIVFSMSVSPRIAKLQKLSKLGFDDEKYELAVVSEVPKVRTGSRIIPEVVNTEIVERKTHIKRTALGDLLMLFMSLEEYKIVSGEMLVISTGSAYIDLCRRQWFINEVVDLVEPHKRYIKSFDLEGAVDFVRPVDQKDRQGMFANALGVKLKDKVSKNYVILKPAEIRKAQRFLKSRCPETPIIGIMPVSKSYLRDWGREIELAEKMPEATFLVFHHQLLPQFDGYENIVNLSGKTTVIEMCALASQTDCGGFTDTGLLHVYGNLGLPYVLIAGGVIPPNLRAAYYDFIFPLTGQCQYSPCFDGVEYDCIRSINSKRCMSEKVISMDTVLKTVFIALEAKHD